MATYPISTRAIITTPPKEGPHVQWSLQSVKLREPADGEILVRIVATGICHTDLVISMMPQEIGSYPKVLGHEGAGVVERIGSRVNHVKAGDLVLISFDYCNESACLNCSQGAPSYCPQFMQHNVIPKPDVVETETGEKAAGFFFGQSSFSARTLVKEKSALNVTGIVTEDDLKWLAPLGCGIMTGAGAVTELANASEVDRVAVMGLGGVGMSAIMVRRCSLCFCGGLSPDPMYRQRKFEARKLSSAWTGFSPVWISQNQSERRIPSTRLTFPA
jgi:Zn-dependent alcohol dehydrogenase